MCDRCDRIAVGNSGRVSAGFSHDDAGVLFTFDVDLVDGPLTDQMFDELFAASDAMFRTLRRAGDPS